MMQSHWSLKRFYLFLNRKWFGAYLPTDVEVRFQPCTGAWGELRCLGGGKFQINIDTALRGMHDFMLITLLHEMCHLKVALDTGKWYTRNIHGPKSKWANEMKSLAARGAFNDLW